MCCSAFHLAGSRGLAFVRLVWSGIGVLRSDLESFDELVGFDNTEVAWDFGGGVIVFFGQHVGIRGDIRYFRTFGDVDFGPIQVGDSDAVDYTRSSIGLVLRY